jgi:hypothetical protein
MRGVATRPCGSAVRLPADRQHAPEPSRSTSCQFIIHPATDSGQPDPRRRYNTRIPDPGSWCALSLVERASSNDKPGFKGAVFKAVRQSKEYA